MTSDPAPTPAANAREAERHDAQVKAGADRPPTPEEAKIAEQQSIDASVAETYKDQIERGAAQKGEGRIP